VLHEGCKRNFSYVSVDGDVQMYLSQTLEPASGVVRENASLWGRDELSMTRL
jgi:hypothetical protein